MNRDHTPEHTREEGGTVLFENPEGEEQVTNIKVRAEIPGTRVTIVIVTIATYQHKLKVHPKCFHASNNYLSTASGCCVQFQAAWIICQVGGGKQIKFSVGVKKHIKTYILMVQDIPRSEVASNR